MRILATCLLALGCVAQAACTTCADGGDVLLTLKLDGSVGANVTRLEIRLSLSGGPQQVHELDVAAGVTSGQTVLLSPTKLPNGGSYELALDVTARRKDGTIGARGRTVLTADTDSCNRAELELASESLSDLSLSDLSLVDLSAGDLAPCTGGGPDEDGDGRADVCDVCPANGDAIPADADSDGLSDACDPQATPNGRVYFEPFNAAPAGWTGTYTVSSSQLQVQVSGTGSTDVATVASNVGAPWKPAFHAQTFVTPTATVAGINAGMRMYLWRTVGSTGYVCEIGWRGGAAPVIQLGQVGGTQMVTALPGPIVLGETLRFIMFATVSVATAEPIVGCLVEKLDGTPLGGLKNLASFGPTDSLTIGLGVGVNAGSASGGLAAQFSSLFVTSYAL